MTIDQSNDHAFIPLEFTRCRSRVLYEHCTHEACDEDVLSLSLDLVFAITDCQDSASGACRLWADPHLLMFPQDEAQEELRMSYHCTKAGRLNVLKNRFIEVTVNVTEEPYWNQDVRYDLPFCPSVFISYVLVRNQIVE